MREKNPASGANQPGPIRTLSRISPGSQTVEGFEPLVDADVAAEFLGITRRTLLQKVRSGKIPGYPLDVSAQKNDWRFKLSELDRFVTAQLNSFPQPT